MSVVVPAPNPALVHPASGESAEPPAVEARGLVKCFGSFEAVRGVDLTIRRGEYYGFLGPNGAGKTTTIRMMLGLLAPTAGNTLIFGAPVSRDSFALKRRVGVALEHAAFYEEMTALEYLRFFVRLFSVEGGEARIHSLLDRLNLLHFGNVVIASYSTGMRRKLNFARALLHRPEMLILDEPGSGLDPFGMKQVREILDEERRAGVTILVSSHILSEIERTVDRVGILAQGRLIAEDSMASLRKRVRVTQRLVIEIAGDARRAAAALRDLPCTAGVEAHEQILHVEIIDEPESRSAVSRALVASDALIIEMRRQELTLEETFINITEAYIGQLAGNGPPQSGGAGTS